MIFRKKILTIIIPVFNEEKTINELIEKVFNANLGSFKKEVIVINDGSNDQTWKILKNLKLKFNLVLLNHKKNMGKSTAIRTGIKKTTGEVVVIQDGDLEYDPNDFKKMLKKMSEPDVRVVYGSRRLEKRNKQYSGLSFYLGGLSLTYVVNFLYGGHITDEPTCYKMFDARLLKNIKLESKRFEFCPEVTAKVLKKGEKIFEVPIIYQPRHVDEGKKIKLKDFFEAMWVLIKYRFLE